MENLRDKMLKAIRSVRILKLNHQHEEDWDGIAEACARVAEEEIAKVIEEAAKSARLRIDYKGGYTEVVTANDEVIDIDEESILQLK